jgi:sialate O-acetylesterase
MILIALSQDTTGQTVIHLILPFLIKHGLQMKNTFFGLLLLPLFLICWSYSYAAIKLPAIISNNMVLQQKSKAALWGWANAGEKVAITTSWNNKTINVNADANGKWL